MGNASVKADGSDGGQDSSERFNAMENSPPNNSPLQSPSPFLFAPQLPIVPLQGHTDASPAIFNQWMTGCQENFGAPIRKGIPTLIKWEYGGNEVCVEGSWDNWTTRKALHRSGKDHSLLLVLPSGTYHYKLFEDGQPRHVPDLPFITDLNGQISNVLDVSDIVPENTETVKEFERPPSPVTSYTNPFPEDLEFAKDPPELPPQLQPSSLVPQNADGSPAKPQHVVLDHLLIEKGRANRSVVALSMTTRYRAKYVTLVLYKPLKK